MDIQSFNSKNRQKIVERIGRNKKLQEAFSNNGDDMQDSIKDELQRHSHRVYEKISESRLPENPNVDPQYGVPEQKKFPLFDEDHVRSAIRFFNYVDAEYEKKLARAILAKMRKYKIPYDTVGKENRLYRWIPDSFKTKKEEKD